MTLQTKLSAKGQCVIPQAVRDRKGWRAGDPLDVFEGEDSVTLRKRDPALARLGPPLSIEEMLAVFASFPAHEGPPVTIEAMDAGVLAEAAARYRRKSAR